MTKLPIYTPTLPMATEPEELVIKNFGLGQHIKDTKSLCPICLDKIEAKVFERDGSVYMDKTCAEHGDFQRYWRLRENTTT